MYFTQGWNIAKRCINRTREKCNKTQCIYHTRVKYNKDDASIAKGRNASNIMYLAHKREKQQKRCINSKRKKCIKTQFIYRTRVIYSKNDVSIAQGRNASNTMYWPHKGEIQQKRCMNSKRKKCIKTQFIYCTRVKYNKNDVSIAEGRIGTKHNVLTAEGWYTIKKIHYQTRIIYTTHTYFITQE